MPIFLLIIHLYFIRIMQTAVVIELVSTGIQAGGKGFNTITSL